MRVHIILDEPSKDFWIQDFPDIPKEWRSFDAIWHL